MQTHAIWIKLHFTKFSFKNFRYFIIFLSTISLFSVLSHFTLLLFRDQLILTFDAFIWSLYDFIMEICVIKSNRKIIHRVFYFSIVMMHISDILTDQNVIFKYIKKQRKHFQFLEFPEISNKMFVICFSNMKFLIVKWSLIDWWLIYKYSANMI